MSKLPNQVNQYFTDELVIKYSDLTETTDNTAQSFTYVIPAGSQVVAAAAHVRTAFADSGGGDELTVIVGDGADPNGLLADFEAHTDGTPATYVCNTGALIDSENGKTYATADTIDIVFTPNATTGDDYNLAEATAGEIVFKFAIIAIDAEG